MFRFPIPVPVFVYTCACVSEFTLWSLSRPKPMTHQLSSPDFHAEEKSEQLTSIGQIKPELYRLRQGDQGDGKQDTCGKISFLLRYAFKWVHSDPSHHYLLSHGEASRMELSHNVNPCLSIHQWVINRLWQGSQLKRRAGERSRGVAVSTMSYSQACRGQPVHVRPGPLFYRHAEGH